MAVLRRIRHRRLGGPPNPHSKGQIHSSDIVTWRDTTGKQRAKEELPRWSYALTFPIIAWRSIILPGSVAAISRISSEPCIII